MTNINIATIKVTPSIEAKTRTINFPSLGEERTISNDSFGNIVELVIACLGKHECPNLTQKRILNIDEDIYFYVPDSILETSSDEDLREYVIHQLGE